MAKILSAARELDTKGEGWLLFFSESLGDYNEEDFEVNCFAAAWQ